MVSLPDTKNSSFKTQSHRGKKSLRARGSGDQGGGGTGRAGEEQSRMDSGSGRQGLTHTHPQG